MSFVVRNDLGKFAEKLKNWQTTGSSSVVQKALDLISEKMLSIAKEEYLGVSSVNLNTPIDKNRVTLTASGKGLMFIEFGTGLVGEGTYEGKLPKDPITFESPQGSGDMHTTMGWEYYYDNPKTKILGGWFWGNTFTRGQPAQMQMFNTMKRVREYIKTDLAKDIRKES